VRLQLVFPTVRISWAVLLAIGFVTGCRGLLRINDNSIQLARYDQVQTWLSDLATSQMVLIDVRPLQEHIAEHIQGSIRIGLPGLTKADPRLVQASRIVVYASGWSDSLSPAAAKRLLSLGYSQVYDFRGGLSAWKRRGGPVSGVEVEQP